jgi:hypothetical protein
VSLPSAENFNSTFLDLTSSFVKSRSGAYAFNDKIRAEEIRRSAHGLHDLAERFFAEAKM